MYQFGTGLIAWIGYGLATIMAVIAFTRWCGSLVLTTKDPFRARKLSSLALSGFLIAFAVAIVTRWFVG